MKKLLVVLVCLGVSLNMPVGLEAANERQTINISAVCANSEIKIIKGEGYHDTAVMGKGASEKIAWNLDCLNCNEIQGGINNKAQICGGNIIEYWIQSVEFVADLDDAAERITSGDTAVQVKKTRKNNGVGLLKPGDFVGKSSNTPNSRRQKARRKSENKHLESDALNTDFPDDLHELWKYTIVVTAYADPPPANAVIVDETNFVDMKAVCEALIECDYWDPHIYVHGDGKPGR